ncbi:nucleoside phosphorylase [Olivibacter sp. SDN3]|uniref:nucleoside phosphorylase n=1 Tax=Olivibacter sp. SDN3 TaxID=2764720 RepID=UPI0016511ACA|nr:nucleoside phosphorylase [Olivibacter sp. SDN3]QNL48609.1 nucleoside phosphorylase [Olivibacter sp. SDN3]
MANFSETDIILNADGSIYHLNLLPEDVADIIITVGDPERVAEVSKYFDSIELKKGKREFITHTGFIGRKRISVISTGIGTDNIDIVLNELDILVNIDLSTRTTKPKETFRSLHIIRIGTSGAVQPNIPVGTLLASTYGLGFDNLMCFYSADKKGLNDGLHQASIDHFSNIGIRPYITSASGLLLEKLAYDLPKGITLTSPGFYAPQGRSTRAHQVRVDLLERINSFRYHGRQITNLEMETAGIYALAKLLGHQAVSINAILASRVNHTFSQHPSATIEKAIQLVLERI